MEKYHGPREMGEVSHSGRSGERRNLSEAVDSVLGAIASSVSRRRGGEEEAEALPFGGEGHRRGSATTSRAEALRTR